MGLGDILESIRSEAEETATTLLAEAREQADRVLDHARAEAESEEQRLASSLDDRMRAERARVLSLSHLEGARSRRAAREEVYQEALEAVRHRLVEIRESPRYEHLMGALFDEAFAALPAATAISVDPEDLPVIERVLSEREMRIVIEVETTPLGGVVLKAPGQGVDNRLAMRLARADAYLRFVAGEIVPELRGAPD